MMEPSMSDANAQEDRLGRVQSLVRAFGLLDILSSHPQGLTLTEVSRIIGLPRSTAHRLLTTMASLRYVSFDEATSQWQVGIQAFTVGNAFAETRDLAKLGRPIMRSLMLDTAETINVSVADGQKIHFLAQVRSERAPPTAARPGVHLPLHSTAAGKAMLSQWNPGALDAFVSGTKLQRRTNRTITDASTLVSHLRQIGAGGFAYDDEENAIGTRCIAAPLFDPAGNVRASLSISAPCARIPDDRVAKSGAILASAAARMSADLGTALVV